MSDAAGRVVVVGGGVAGLTAAYRLASEGLDVMVHEAADRTGGAIAPLALEGSDDGLTVEGGADSFVVRKPWALDLCRDLGLDDELVYPGAPGAFVWARGRLVPYPEGSAFGIPSRVGDMLGWRGLSRRGRLRAATEVYRPARAERGDQSVGALAERRLGRECARVLVGPLLAGINAADPDRLSVEATFPELARWEERHGSLIRGARAARKGGGGGPLFATVRGGLARLVDALVGVIGPARVRTSSNVTALAASGDGRGFELQVTGPSGAERVEAEAVVLAVPADAAAVLLGGVAPEAASELGSIPCVSTAVIALGYPEGTADLLPDATGFVVPAGSRAGGQGTVITACTWVSRKWPDPAFGDRAVVRAFVGRAGDEAILERSDPEIVAAVVRDLEAIAPVGEMPEAAGIVRWDRAMPQYEVGHLDRVARIEDALATVPGVFVAGSAYRGVGIADCVRQGNEAAARARDHLAIERTTAWRREG